MHLGICHCRHALPILSHHATISRRGAVTIARRWAVLLLHGSKRSDPLLQMCGCGVHLFLPLFPLGLVVLELVFVRVGLELLIPQFKVPVPVLVHWSKLLLLHIIVFQLHIQWHGLEMRRLLDELLILL